MNVDRIEQLIQTLETCEYFDMGDFFTSCGAPSCMAGYLLNNEQPDCSFDDIVKQASDIIGIQHSQGYELFMPITDVSHSLTGGFTMSLITKEQSINTLRHLITTGNVDWLAANGTHDEEG